MDLFILLASSPYYGMGLEGIYKEYADAESKLYEILSTYISSLNIDQESLSPELIEPNGDILLHYFGEFFEIWIQKEILK